MEDCYLQSVGGALFEHGNKGKTTVFKILENNCHNNLKIKRGLGKGKMELGFCLLQLFSLLTLFLW